MTETISFLDRQLADIERKIGCLRVEHPEHQEGLKRLQDLIGRIRKREQAQTENATV